MSDKTARKPFGNFFIKKSIQLKIIATIVSSVIVAAFVTSTMLIIIYTAKSSNGSFYYMSNDIMQDLELKSIIGIILPSLLIAQAAGIAIALGVGMFTSRKIAVPLYKIEKWATRLKSGRLGTKLEFREGDQMQEYALHCNDVTRYFRDILKQIHDGTVKIDHDPANSEMVKSEIAKIRTIISSLEL